MKTENLNKKVNQPPPPPPPPPTRKISEDITPSATFAIGAFLLGIILALGASYSMEHSPKKPKTCHYPEKLEAICTKY